jgi:hypothetical protein
MEIFPGVLVVNPTLERVFWATPSPSVQRLFPEEPIGLGDSLILHPKQRVDVPIVCLGDPQIPLTGARWTPLAMLAFASFDRVGTVRTMEPGRLFEPVPLSSLEWTPIARLGGALVHTPLPTDDEETAILIGDPIQAVGEYLETVADVVALRDGVHVLRQVAAWIRDLKRYERTAEFPAEAAMVLGGALGVVEATFDEPITISFQRAVGDEAQPGWTMTVYQGNAPTQRRNA